MMKKSTLLIAVFVLCPFFVHAATIQAAPTKGLVGYWSFDQGAMGTTSAKDLSGKGNTGWLIGGVTKVAGKLMQGLSFRGAGYTNVGNPSTLKLSGNFSVSLWVYNRTSADKIFVIKSTQSTGGVFIGYGFGSKGFVAGASNQVNNPYTEQSVDDLYKWHFVTCTVSGTTRRLYVDGVYVGESSSGTSSWDNEGNVFIGSGAAAGGLTPTYHSNSIIDDVRVNNRALSALEVANLYQSRGVATAQVSTVKNPSGLVGHWTFDAAKMTGATALDSSGSNNTGTLTGGITKVVGKIGQGLKFDGTGRVSVVDADVLDTTTGMSVSSWIQPDNVFYSTVLAKGTGGSSLSSYQLDVVTGGRILFYIYDSDNLAYLGRSTAYLAVATGTPKHVVATWDGTSSDSGIKIYVNGVRADVYNAGAGSFVAARNISQPFTIGARATGLFPFTGKIDDVRIYSRALSMGEIAEIYRQGGGSKQNVSTVGATSATTNLVSGLVGYWSFDGDKMGTTSVYDLSGNNNTGWLTGGVKKVIGKIGQGLKFDGSSGRVEMPVGSVELGAGDFAISLWAKFGNSTNRWQRLFGKKGLVAENVGYSIYYGGDTGKLMWSTANGTTGSEKWTVNSFSKSIWHHIVMVRNSSDAKVGYFFVDGVRQELASVPAILDTTGGTIQPSIGTLPGATGLKFEGTIDDVRVYSRALSAPEVLKLYRMGR